MLKFHKGPALSKHEIYHLVALLIELKDDYTPDWKHRILAAVGSFHQGMVEASDSAKTDNPNEFWNRYGAHTQGTGTDRARTFNRRHPFYLRWMRDELKPTPKDLNRTFEPLLREILWYQAGGVCAYSSKDFCASNEEMPFAEAQVHHIIPHSLGGSTCIENAALVHATCNLDVDTHIEPVPLGKGEYNNGVLVEDCSCDRKA